LIFLPGRSPVTPTTRRTGSWGRNSTPSARESNDLRRCSTPSRSFGCSRLGSRCDKSRRHFRNWLFTVVSHKVGQHGRGGGHNVNGGARPWRVAGGRVKVSHAGTEPPGNHRRLFRSPMDPTWREERLAGDPWRESGPVDVECGSGHCSSEGARDGSKGLGSGLGRGCSPAVQNG